MGKIAELWIHIGAKTDELNKGLSDAEKAIQKVGREFDAVGQKFQAAGRSMALAGAAILAPVAASVISFGKFDAAMNESMAIMGDLTDAMKRDMVNAAKEVAQITTFSAVQAAEAFYFLASAGLDVKASIAALPVVAKFAQAGMFDMALATEYLMDAQSALGLKIKDDAIKNMENMIRVGDVLVKAAVLSQASVEQFSEALTNRAGPALRMVGKDIEEGVAVLAAFADQGIKGAEAGTRLDIVLRDLQTRTIKNAEVFEKYGVAVFDSNGEMRNMADIIADLERALEGMSDKRKRSILIEMDFQDRSVASILAIIGMSDAIRHYEKEARKAGETMDKVSRKQLETLNAQMKLAKNQIEIVAITIGSTLEPTLIKITGALKTAAKAMWDLTEKHPVLVSWITHLGTALGGLLLIGGSVIFMFGTFLRSVGAIITVLPILKAKLIGLTGIFGLITTGLIVIGEASIRAAKQFKAMSNLIEDAAESQGKKVGWLEKTWHSLNAAYQKVGLGVDVVKIAQKELAEQTEVVTKANIEAAKSFLEAFKKTDLYAKGIVIARGILENFGFVTKKIKDGMGTLGEKIKGLTLDFEKFGIKTKSQLTVELKDAEEALRELKSSTEATPGAIKTLKDGIKSLKEQLYGAKEETKSFKDEIDSLSIGITTTAIPAARDMSRAWSSAVAAMESETFGKMKTITETIKTSTEESEKNTEKIISDWVNMTAEMARAFSEGFLEMMRTAQNFSGFFAAFAEGLFRMFSTAIGKMISDMITGLGKLTDNIKVAAVAFAAYVSVNLIQRILEVVGILKARVDADVQVILDKINEAIRAGKELITTISKSQLAAPSPTRVPAGTPIDRSEWALALELIEDYITSFQKLGKWTQSSEDAMQALIDTAKKFGMEGSQAMIDVILKMRELGIESKALRDYILSQLSTIPSALLTLINNVKSTWGQAVLKLADDIKDKTNASFRRLKQLGRVAIDVFNALIAEGKSYMEALTLMQEPLNALIKKFRDLGKELPKWLQPMADLLDKMKLKPAVFQNLDAAMSILRALQNTAYMTQNSFNALSQSAAAFAKTLLDVTGNLNQALQSMTLTGAQIQQLLPIISQFVGVAAMFGLGIPAWMRTFVERFLPDIDWKEFRERARLAANAGVATWEELKELNNRIFNTNKALANIGQVLRGGFADVVNAIKGIGGTTSTRIKAYQAGGIAWTPQLAAVAEKGPEIIIPLNQLQPGKQDYGMTPSAPMNINFYAEPLIIETKDNKITVDFVIKKIERGEVRIPLSAVRGN